MPPGIAIDDLPVLDVVLLSHDHYDHADATSIRRLQQRFPQAEWFVPLGLKRLVTRLGNAVVHELDWWDTSIKDNLTITSVPAQHFSGRGFRRNRSLWCGFVVAGGDHKAYFVGDTGWFPEFSETARRCGPFDVILMPIGAYDPRWFMRPVHLDPEEAVRAYQSLSHGTAHARACYMVANHWGTFKLTLEPLDEPPRRLRDAWAKHQLRDEQLWVMAHGETRWLPDEGRGAIVRCNEVAPAMETS